LGAQSKPLAIIEELDPEKPSFRPSKWPQKFRNRKTAKNSKLPENCFEPVGIGGWPLISTWITVLRVATATPTVGLRGTLRTVQREIFGGSKRGLLQMCNNNFWIALKGCYCSAFGVVTTVVLDQVWQENQGGFQLCLVSEFLVFYCM
jgi:hypothetical protein